MASTAAFGPALMTFAVLFLLIALPSLSSRAAASSRRTAQSTTAQSRRQGRNAVVTTYLDDEVLSLPQAPNHAFRMYSGYVEVNATAGRNLFYYFVEAAVDDPSTLPLVLWLNGGPGCSSVGGGLMTELGPFFPTTGGSSLRANEYSWNLAANMLFLESPAGVGFSYTENATSYTTGDKQTAVDALNFVKGWLTRFPHYQSRDFYISGESYAGHYVPQLAAEILNANDPTINFKGFLLGNPWTNGSLDDIETIRFWWDAGIISTATYRSLLTSCATALFDPSRSEICDGYFDEALQEMGEINLYGIYFDVCSSDYSGRKGHSAASLANHARALMKYRMRGRFSLMKKRSSMANGLKSAAYDPCVEDEAELYLNRPEVQAAIHAKADLPYKWTDCTDDRDVDFDYSYEDFMGNVLPVYETLLKSSIRMWIFSGDVDGVVPFRATRYWVEYLQSQGLLNETAPLTPWYTDGQVGGRSTQYNGGSFSYVTVRDAGHMVPYMQPARALTLFRSFLAGEFPTAPAQFHK